MARNKSGFTTARSWQSHIAKLGWNKVIYDQINGIEKGPETTSLRKQLRLGKRKSLRFRKRLKSFRVRVSRIRLRVKITPMLWLKKLVLGYVHMMVQVQNQVGGVGGLVIGFHAMSPAKFSLS